MANKATISERTIESQNERIDRSMEERHIPSEINSRFYFFLFLWRNSNRLHHITIISIFDVVVVVPILIHICIIDSLIRPTRTTLTTDGRVDQSIY